MKVYHRSLTVFLSLTILLFSCKKERQDKPAYVAETIEIEAEGAEATIELSDGNWGINHIQDVNSNRYLSGDLLDLNGEHIELASALRLFKFGRLRTNEQDRGFEIIHEAKNKFILKLKGNTSPQAFNFSIAFISGLQEREVLVSQKKLTGYRFDKVRYFLDEGDGYSLSTLQYVTKYTTDAEYQFYPLRAFSLQERSYFTTDELNGFALFGGDSLRINVPVSVSGNQIILSSDKQVYSPHKRLVPYHAKSNPAISLPKGFYYAFFLMEHKKCQVSYVLTLVNEHKNRSLEVSGKWIQEIPTENLSYKTLAL